MFEKISLFVYNAQLWWDGIPAPYEELVYRFIAGFFLMLAIGVMIGVYSYIKRCIKDPTFY